MNKQQLMAELDRIGMHPGKVLGQNFLADGNLLAAIVRDAEIKKNDVILEVGPGLGALTKLMLAQDAEVYAVEFDHRLAEYLRAELGSRENFHLTEADACRVDFTEILPPGKPFRAIANLPYAVSSIFIADMTELENRPGDMLFMLQKEMAMRLAATVGTKNYGALSVKVQLFYDVKIVRAVPPGVFFPPPKVASTIVRFVATARDEDDVVLHRAAKFAKVAFAQRRKQIGSTLGAVMDKDVLEDALQDMGYDLKIRPERLTVTDFIELAKKLT